MNIPLYHHDLITENFIRKYFSGKCPLVESKSVIEQSAGFSRSLSGHLLRFALLRLTDSVYHNNYINNIIYKVIES